MLVNLLLVGFRRVMLLGDGVCLNMAFFIWDRLVEDFFLCWGYCGVFVYVDKMENNNVFLILEIVR